jgi:hypothetical protein
MLIVRTWIDNLHFATGEVKIKPIKDSGVPAGRS